MAELVAQLQAMNLEEHEEDAIQSHELVQAMATGRRAKCLLIKHPHKLCPHTLTIPCRRHIDPSSMLMRDPNYNPGHVLILRGPLKNSMYCESCQDIMTEVLWNEQPPVTMLDKGDGVNPLPRTCRLYLEKCVNCRAPKHYVSLCAQHVEVGSVTDMREAGADENHVKVVVPDPRYGGHCLGCVQWQRARAAGALLVPVQASEHRSEHESDPGSEHEDEPGREPAGGQ